MRSRLFVIGAVIVLGSGCAGQNTSPSLLPQDHGAPSGRVHTSTTGTCDSSISGNFNGTSIPAGSTLWFSAVMKVAGMGSAPTTINVSNSTISFTANGTPYTIPVPASSVKIDPTAHNATISSGSNGWTETAPYPFSGNVLLDAVQFPVTSGLPGGIQNVAWNAHLSTAQAGVSVQWQWSAAVYKQFSSDYSALGVKPVDANNTSQYTNSDHAGTPENYKPFVTGGATGGGGSNYTGSLSATKSVVPCVTAYGYANNLNAGTLDVVDFTSGKIVQSIKTGADPLGVAVQPNTRLAYVANWGDSTISVVDLTTNTVTNTISEPSGSGPGQLVFSPDGTKAYVANYLNGTVGVINTQTETVSATVPNMGARPSGLAMSPDGTRLYVMPNDSTLKVVDASSNTLVTSIDLGGACCFGGNGVTINSAGTRVYVAGSFAYGVAVVDTASNTLIQTFPVAQPLPGTSFTPTTDFVSLNPSGTVLYAGAYDSNELTSFDPTTGAVLAVNSIGGPPVQGNSLDQAFFSADGATIYMATGTGIEVLDANTLSVTMTIPDGEVNSIILPR